ncbi:MAG TPA: nicotinate (nicotinamide) nucleotide adenylyltransferase [Perlabentimonas sp.]|nr:nicotinate (nicotinamide) nucleotide adenylyltransferase [Perlabentimonas sp.]
MKTGLFFGSFNPIHNGHIGLAGYILNANKVDEVWFVVSPHNPLKEKNDLAKDEHRLKMVELAIEAYSPRLSVCDIEMRMPRPSYTVDTINALKAEHLDRDFVIIMGADSISSITRWKDYKSLIANNILVYPRLGYEIDKTRLPKNTKLIDAPIIEISSTYIRELIASNKRADFFMPQKAFEYLDKHKLYK